MKRPSKSAVTKEVAAFNQTKPVGSIVSYQSVLAKGSDPGSQHIITKVRKAAYVASSGDAVVFLENVSGYVLCSHVFSLSRASIAKTLSSAS